MQIGDNLQTPGMKLKCPSVPKQHPQLPQARDESSDLHPCAGPHKTWRHNFSRLPWSSILHNFLRTITFLSPGQRTSPQHCRQRKISLQEWPSWVKKPLFPQVPQKPTECHLFSVGTQPHIYPLLEMPPVAGAAWCCCTDLPTHAGCQHQSDGAVRKTSFKTQPLHPA